MISLNQSIEGMMKDRKGKEASLTLSHNSPNRIFSLIVSFNSQACWVTYAIFPFTSTPPVFPITSSLLFLVLLLLVDISPKTAEMREDFPLPTGPTIQTNFPWGIDRFISRSWKVGWLSAVDVESSLPSSTSGSSSPSFPSPDSFVLVQ